MINKFPSPKLDFLLLISLYLMLSKEQEKNATWDEDIQICMPLIF